MPATSDSEIEAALEGKTVAVVGCSRSSGKAAHDVPAYLQQQGYEIIPVNPYAEEIFGRSVPNLLSDVEESIDVVCIFRPSEEVAEIVDDALEREDVEVIWTQRGIRDEEATARAEADGRTVVEDRCMMVEHRRVMG